MRAQQALSLSEQQRQSLNNLFLDHDANPMIRQFACVRMREAKEEALTDRGIQTLHT